MALWVNREIQLPRDPLGAAARQSDSVASEPSRGHMTGATTIGIASGTSPGRRRLSAHRVGLLSAEDDRLLSVLTNGSLAISAVRNPRLQRVCAANYAAVTARRQSRHSPKGLLHRQEM